MVGSRRCTKHGLEKAAAVAQKRLNSHAKRVVALLPPRDFISLSLKKNNTYYTLSSSLLLCNELFLVVYSRKMFCAFLFSSACFFGTFFLKLVWRFRILCLPIFRPPFESTEERGGPSTKRQTVRSMDERPARENSSVFATRRSRPRRWVVVIALGGSLHLF